MRTTIIGKRAALLLVVVYLVAAMSAAALAADKTTISIWLRGNPQYLEAYQALGEIFMEQNPDIEVVFSLYQDLEDKLLTSALGGALPDAWIMDTVTTGRWVRYGIVAEIDKGSFPDSDKMLDVAWETCKGSDGKYYAVPWSVQGQAMYYRHDWLTKFGQAVPTNWDEMIEFAKYATFNDPDGNGRDDTYGISVYGSTNRGYAYWTFQDWVWQAGGSILREVDDGKWVSNLNTPEVKLALEFERDMAHKHKIFQPGFQTADSSAVYGTFQDGLAAMVFHAGYRILEYSTRLGDKLGTALMPAGPAGGYTLGEGENLYMSKTTKHPEAVYRWMVFMTSPEAQIFGITNPISNVCRVSVRNDIDTAAVSGQPLMEPFVEVFRRDLVRFPEPIVDYYPVKLLASEVVQAVLLDPDTDIDALVVEYDEKINAELKKQNVYGG